jgi:hypothetical protein
MGESLEPKGDFFNGKDGPHKCEADPAVAVAHRSLVLEKGCVIWIDGVFI